MNEPEWEPEWCESCDAEQLESLLVRYDEDLREPIREAYRTGGGFALAVLSADDAMSRRAMN
jgi:hypothetical protein